MVRKFLLGLILSVSFTAVVGQKKLALIVTIDNYPAPSREHPENWNHTCANTDLEVLWQIFHDKQHFDVVDTLTESNATRKGILNALGNLKEKAEKGSIVVFHFSGHGQQIYDVDDSAKGLYIDEADGYDEALVAYDAKNRYSPNGYKGENHIRDEELGAKLDSIRERIGPAGSLLVLVDACQSGTITKDASDRGLYRGSSGKIEPPNYVRKQILDEKKFLNDNNHAASLAPMVVMTGSSQDQFNYPTRYTNGRSIGMLTFAFMKALENFREPVSYKIFFGWIKQIIENNRSGQTPLIEGPDSLMVLGNKIIPTSGFIAVKPIPTARDSVEIDRGGIHDIFPGMEFSVYPLNVFTYDSTNRVAKGKVVASDPFNSKGFLTETKKRMADNDAYKAIFNSKAFGNFSCAVNVKGSSPVLQKIREKISTMKQIVPDAISPDLSIREINGASGQKKLFALQTSITDSRYDTIWQKYYYKEPEIDSVQINGLFSAIKQFARAKYIRSFSLPPNDSTFKDVSVQIIPVIAYDVDAPCGDPNKNGLRLLDTKIEKELSGDSLLKKHKWIEIKAVRSDQDANERYGGFKIKLVNKSDKAVFLSVLEIQPDNIINVRVPHEICNGARYSPADPNNFKIAKGDSTTFLPRVLDFSKPYGLEYLKILVTDNPLNLSGLSGLTKSVDSPRGLDDFLNEIIHEESSTGKYFTKKDGGAPTIPVRSGSMKVVNLTFKIVE